MGLGKQKTEVQKGDSLSKIAKNAGISVSKIKELNPQIKNPNLIKPGQKVTTSSGILGGIGSLGSKFKESLNKPANPEVMKAHMEFLKQTSKDDKPSGIASLNNTGTAGAATGDMADQYAENLRRYEEYMKSQQPKGPEVTSDMRRAALDVFESQQGAGQVPYYMAAARNQYNPNMSPAFQYAAQNYDVLGGSQRLAPRPMEMMSVAERQRINDMAQGMADRQYQQDQYQAGMDMVLRGGGKGGGATIPQTGGGMPRPPLPFASILASRFGGFGGQ